MKVFQLPKSGQNGHPPLRPDQAAVDDFREHLVIPLTELSFSISPKALDCINADPDGFFATAYRHKEQKVLAAAALKLGFDDDIDAMLKSFHLTCWQFMGNKSLSFKHAEAAIWRADYIGERVAKGGLGNCTEFPTSNEVARMLTSHDPGYIDDVADDLLKGGI
mgnify:CR=1 FL=1|jgi:hypothetical protein